MEQYNQETPENISRPEPDKTKSIEDRLRRMESLVYEQNKEILTLRRELLRIKNDVADIAGILQRG